MNINRSKFVKFNPTVEVKSYAINNNYNSLIEDNEAVPLYHVIVSQGELKMLFLVAHTPGKELEFSTIRCEYVSLHGINQRDEYLAEPNLLNSISADTTIVSDLFKWVLEPFGLKLLKVVFHNFEFFESEKELKGFIFEDSSIYDRIKILINRKCCKVLKNPYNIEY